MNIHSAETTNDAIGLVGPAPLLAPNQTSVNPDYEIEMLERLPAALRQEFEGLFREAPFGEAAFGWCEMLQKSKLKGFWLRYLPVRSSRGVVALAIVTLVRRLDATRYFGSPWEHRFAQMGRLGIRPFRFDVAFVEIPFCNLPGVMTVAGTSEEERSRIIEHIVRYLRKRINPHAVLLSAEPSEQLREEPFTRDLERFSIVPNTLLDLCYENFDEYLASLSKKARWDVKDKIKRFDKAEGRLEITAELDGIGDRIYPLFLATHEANRGKTPAMPIEVTPDLFNNLTLLEKDTRRMILAHVGDRLAGFLLVVESGDTLYYKFCGLDYEISRHSKAYFNLFYAGIRYALERGCKKISFGPTSYFNKKRLGCAIKPVDIYADVVRGMLRVVKKVVRFS